MQEAVRRQLNAINQDFYRITAEAFDQTRSQAWEGWPMLLRHVGDDPGATDTLNVLDVGCGNGRFGVFLAEQVTRPIRYHGIDSSPALLLKAEAALSQIRPGLEYQLDHHDLLDHHDPIDHHDLIEDGIPASAAEARYDLVVLFGVLHHIPGAAQRRKLIHDLAQCVRPGGVLVFTVWRFYEFERFRSRIVPWPPELAEKVEQHDYLLDWQRGTPALRYCHYADSHEVQSLIKASGLPVVDQYAADGREAFNQYIILEHHNKGD